MKSLDFDNALRTLQSTLTLYLRHIVLLTGWSLVPALARVALFLELPWMSGRLSGWVEAVVGIFRVVLFVVAFRLVWPDIGAGPQAARSVQAGQATSLGPIPIKITLTEIVCHVVLLALVPLILNWVATLVGRGVTSDAKVQLAVEFALKNLFVIPLWMVYVLAVIRRTFQGV